MGKGKGTVGYLVRDEGKGGEKEEWFGEWRRDEESLNQRRGEEWGREHQGEVGFWKEE